MKSNFIVITACILNVSTEKMTNFVKYLYLSPYVNVLSSLILVHSFRSYLEIMFIVQEHLHINFILKNYGQRNNIKIGCLVKIVAGRCQNQLFGCEKYNRTK